MPDFEIIIIHRQRTAIGAENFSNGHSGSATVGCPPAR